MQKTAKKFLSMLLALMMVLSILPTAVFATEQATVAAPLDSIVPYGANDQTTGTATISVQNPVTFTGYSAFENVPYYLVTVPAGTTYVKTTYKDAAILTNATSGEASGYYADVPQWTGGGVEMAYTESNGDITITIPLNYSRTAEDGTTVQKSFVLGADGSGTAYAPEYDGSASYAPVHFLAFTYESNSAPTVASDAITTANVTLGNAWTLDLADVFTDADGDTLTYTATINGGAITGNGYVAGIVGQTTKGVTACYNTGSITGAGNYVAGIVAFASGASASVKNCYNRAYVESTGSNVGAVVGMTNNASAAMSNLYYLDFTCSQGIGSAKSTAQTATAKTRAEMTKSSFVRAMNTGLTTAAFVSSRYSPALSWQTNLEGLITPSVGNIDMDPFGYVNESDVELLRQYLAGKATLDADQLAQANVDNIGGVDQNDLDVLMQYVAGTINVFPVDRVEED